MTHQEIALNLLKCVKDNAHKNQQRSTAVEACERVVDTEDHRNGWKNGYDTEFADASLRWTYEDRPSERTLGYVVL
mgnify:CR=1 FL=1